MRQVGVLLAFALAACSSEISVQMDEIPATQAAGSALTPPDCACPAPGAAAVGATPVGGFSVTMSMFDPFGASNTPYDTMLDAAASAVRLASGPAPLLGGALASAATGLLSPASLQQRLAAVLGHEAALRDQKRALLELGSALTADLQQPAAGADAAASAQLLATALESRLTRLLVGAAVPATGREGSALGGGGVARSAPSVLPRAVPIALPSAGPPQLRPATVRASSQRLASAPSQSPARTVAIGAPPRLPPAPLAAWSPAASRIASPLRVVVAPAPSALRGAVPPSTWLPPPVVRPVRLAAPRLDLPTVAFATR